MGPLFRRLLRPLVKPALHLPDHGSAISGISTIAAAQRETALFAADLMGAQAHFGQFAPPDGRSLERGTIRNLIERAVEGCMLIDPRPGLHIVDINDPYGAATLTRRSAVAGAKLFDVFPDNPALTDADGVCNLFHSIHRAAQSGAPDRMAPQRYDVRNAAGHFVQRTWQPVNIPLLDDAGRVVYILHQATEVPVRPEALAAA